MHSLPSIIKAQLPYQWPGVLIPGDRGQISLNIKWSGHWCWCLEVSICYMHLCVRYFWSTMRLIIQA